MKSPFTERTQLLVVVVNEILISCEFSNILKTTVVNPLYKNGNKSHMGNSRSFSLCNLGRKLALEKKKKENLEKSCQFDFKQNICAEDAVIKLVSEIHHSTDNNRKFLCIFLDTAKFFHIVNHSKLLDSLLQLVQDWSYSGVT